MDPETAYDVLDLDTSASEEEIKQAYRTLTKEYHPDLTDGETREHWIQINEAKETLLNGNHSTTQTANRSTRTSTTQKTQSSTDSSDTNEQSQRSYQRDHSDRGKRQAHSKSSRSDSSSSKQRQKYVREISFKELGQKVVGERVRIKGVVADVTTSTSDDIELIVTLVSPKNSYNTIEVYIHESLRNRPTFTSTDKYRITGVVRDGIHSDGLEIHVSDGHNVTRLQTDRDWSHVRDKYRENNSTSRTQQTETPGTKNESGRVDSVRSTLSSVGLLLLGLLMWPGLVVQQHVRPLYQVVAIIVATGLMSSVSGPFIYDILYLASLLFFAIGGMFAFGLTSIFLLQSGETITGLGFVFGFLLVSAYYGFIRLAIDAE